MWYAITALVAVVISALITYVVTTNLMKKNADSKIGNAEEKAREIIDEALKTAETKKREGLLEVKEESIRTKNELDKEIKERRAEVQRYERRIQQKEENIDKNSEKALFNTSLSIPFKANLSSIFFRGSDSL